MNARKSRRTSERGARNGPLWFSMTKARGIIKNKRERQGEREGEIEEIISP